MQLAVLTPTISRNAGGLFQSVRYLHDNISSEIPTKIYSFRDEYTRADLQVWGDMPINTYSFIGPAALKYSPMMSRALINDSPDLVHVHGLWYGTSIASSSFHRKSGRLYLVSPRGMLDGWALANSAMKKRIAAALFENRHLRGSACLHALCESEGKAMGAYGLKNPVAVIPNGVELVNAERLETGKLNPEKKILLFLGRVHPKKGLINALRALSEMLKTESGKLKIEEWQFVIAGWDQGGHEAELKELATELGIRWADARDSGEKSSAFSFQFSESQLLFVGPAFGDTKDALLRSASAFILPSFSEGLPMSVLEAWSYGLPVLKTDHCNIPEGFAADAALRIDTDVANIATGLSELFQSSTSDLHQLGDNGRALVERQFTWDQVAAQMKEVYEWILGGGGVPDCVRQF